MERQVTIICPKTGRTVWVYEDLGRGAAKVNHGNPGHPRGAIGPGLFVAPKAVSKPRRAA